MKKQGQGNQQNQGVSPGILKHGDDDIFGKNPIFLVF